MGKFAFVLLLLVLAACVHAAGGEYTAADASAATQSAQAGQGVIGSGAGFYQNAGWLRDWRAASTIAVAISIAIVALGYVFGFALNSREIKMWASMELVQVFGSVLIIVALIGLIAFFDIVGEEVSRGTMRSINSESVCADVHDVRPCSMKVADAYIGSIMDAAKDSAKSQYTDAIADARVASERYGMQLTTVYALWVGGSVGPNAGKTMAVDKHNAIFDYYAKILASLQAQKYFIDVITFGIGPIFLLVGVVLRTFFATRKLGGLLLAIAVALMIIYPLTYMLSWLTLIVSLYGDRTFGPSSECPAECTLATPIAVYRENANYPNAVRRINGSDEIETMKLSETIVINGGRVIGIGPAGSRIDVTNTFRACFDLSEYGITNENACENCPSACREVPYPTTNPICADKTIESACRKCDIACKVVRIRSSCGAGCRVISDACKVNQSMEGISIQAGIVLYPANPNPMQGCDACAYETGDANNPYAVCPAFCRVREGNTARSMLAGDKPTTCGNNVCDICMQPSRACAINLSSDGNSCETQCPVNTCPQYCRVMFGDGRKVKDVLGIAGCENCPATCSAGCYATPPINDVCSLPIAQNAREAYCQMCPLECRYASYALPAGSNNPGSICSEYGSSCTDNAKCAAACKADAFASACREYHAGGGLACENFPLECRIKLRYEDPAHAGSYLYQEKSALCNGNVYDNACVAPCSKELALPSDNVECKPYVR